MPTLAFECSVAVPAIVSEPPFRATFLVTPSATQRPCTEPLGETAVPELPVEPMVPVKFESNTALLEAVGATPVLQLPVLAQVELTPFHDVVDVSA